MKHLIYDFNRDELIDFFRKHDSSSYRATQVWEYLYKERVVSFSQMIDLNKKAMEILEDKFRMSNLRLKHTQESKDGTIKFLFQLEDDNIIETVMMPHPYGISVCVTTQVGCNMGCSFCASGLNAKLRDLSSGEIVQQVLKVQQFLDERNAGEIVSNVVVMGIGEPFDNYDNVINFTQIITDHKGLSIPGRHVTISTCGLVPRIKEFADKKYPINLAISLHAPNDALRNKIMKINKAYPLKELIDTLNYYLEKTNRRMTIEYILLFDINDRLEHAKELVQLLGHLNKRDKFYVNLIPFNPVDEYSQYKRSPKERVLAFYDFLRKNDIHCQIRQEYGTDIDAACGQLRSKYLNK